MLTGIAAGLAAGALWGLVFVAPRMVSGYSSVDLTAGRFAAFGAISLVVMLLTLRTRARPTLRQAATAFGMSLLGFSGYYVLLVLAIRDAGSEVPTLIIGTIPIWIMLLGKPAGLRWAGLLPGLVLTALGLGLMMGSPHATGGAAPVDYWRGVLLALVTMAGWTAYGILNAAWLRRHPEINATDWANWLGVATGAGALVLWLTVGTDLRTLGAREDVGVFIALCLALGVGSAWMATVLWNVASRRLSASLCGQLIVSETLFALLYSFAWDGHWPTLAQSAACTLFACGILASIRAHR